MPEVSFVAGNWRKMFTIRISFEQYGLSPVTLENIEPGQSLLEVFLKNGIDLHHNCGGVCSCTTCHLYVQKGAEHLEEKSRREEDFIKRSADPRLNSRLGCQCLMVDNKGEVEVLLPDQTRNFS